MKKTLLILLLAATPVFADVIHVPLQAAATSIVGPDGNLWATENLAGLIARITQSGALTSFPAGEPALFQIVSGPDGNLWYAAGEAIGRMTAQGAATLFPTSRGSLDIARRQRWSDVVRHPPSATTSGR